MVLFSMCIAFCISLSQTSKIFFGGKLQQSWKIKETNYVGKKPCQSSLAQIIFRGKKPLYYVLVPSLCVPLQESHFLCPAQSQLGSDEQAGRQEATKMIYTIFYFPAK